MDTSTNDTHDVNESQPDAQQEAIVLDAHPRRSRRTFLLAAGGVGLAAVLGGAAYVAGNLLNASQKDGAGGGNDFMLNAGGPGGKQVKMYHSPKIKNAPEIPNTPPDVTGLYVRRQDNSVYVGTGEVQVMIQRDATGKSQANAKHSGPDVEVVVNHDTKLYEDKTPITQQDMEADRELQQVVAPITSLDDLLQNISTTDSLNAWGQRIGDRLIAKIVLHRPPMLLGGPAGK